MTETRPYPQRARERIAGTKIIDRLVAHVNGEIELTPAQVASARILLSKVLPDMKSVEVDGHAQLKTVSTRRLSDEQLMAIAQGKFKPEAIEGQCEAVQELLKLAADQRPHLRLRRNQGAFSGREPDIRRLPETSFPKISLY